MALQSVCRANSRRNKDESHHYKPRGRKLGCYRCRGSETSTHVPGLARTADGPKSFDKVHSSLFECTVELRVGRHCVGMVVPRREEYDSAAASGGSVHVHQ